MAHAGDAGTRCAGRQTPKQVVVPDAVAVARMWSALVCALCVRPVQFHKRECACGLAELLHADVEAVFGCISSNQEVMAR
jgi:hypothetical protein